MPINHILCVLSVYSEDDPSELENIFFIEYRSHILFVVVYGEYFQTILVQPQSTEVAVGETVVLDCTVFNQYGDVAWYVKIIEKIS